MLFRSVLGLEKCSGVNVYTAKIAKVMLKMLFFKLLRLKVQQNSHNFMSSGQKFMCWGRNFLRVNVLVNSGVYGMPLIRISGSRYPK